MLNIKYCLIFREKIMKRVYSEALKKAQKKYTQKDDVKERNRIRCRKWYSENKYRVKLKRCLIGGET